MKGYQFGGGEVLPNTSLIITRFYRLQPYIFVQSKQMTDLCKFPIRQLLPV